MKIITLLAFSADLAGIYATAAPHIARDAIYPNGAVVKYYFNGLPAGLYPGPAGHAKRGFHLDFDAPGVGDLTNPRVGVYACTGKNFSDICVFFRSFPGQCGR